ncbi:phage tail protein [Vibrio owensii]|uniref:phage tail protein n=1 Tax=Vibrio owensii TaxID=696485 RepID=UPI0040681BEC
MSEPFIGQVDLYGFDFAPEQWARCEGQLLAIDSNQAMFSLLGTAYGGDGRTKFGLPDLRGTVAVSQGNFPGSLWDWKVGNRRGSETHTLTVSELAQHKHTASFASTDGNLEVSILSTPEAGTSNAPLTASYCATATPPTGGADGPEQIYYTGDPKPPPGDSRRVKLGGMDTRLMALNGIVTVDQTGNAQAFGIMQPGVVMNYSIALQGLFPSRN